MTHRLILAAAVFASNAFAQSEAALRSFFEGKRVTVKIEMPATKWGIDVHPGNPSPVDFRAYSQRIKEHGIALRPGDAVLITGVKVKEKLIEFQLGGGGYGTLWDDTNTSVYVPTAGKSTRERDLEQSIKKETDSAARRKLQNELSDLRSARTRDNQVAEALAAQASAVKEQTIREKAAQSGSRFNIRVASGDLRANTPSPASVMEALAEYVDFGALRQ